MNIKNLFNDFEKQFLYISDRPKPKQSDKQINKIDIMTAFSVFVNYHSDKLIRILKDTQLTSYLWRDIKKRYDLTKLYLNYDKLHNLI